MNGNRYRILKKKILNPTDIYERSEAERIGRSQVRELVEFLQKNLIMKQKTLI